MLHTARVFVCLTASLWERIGSRLFSYAHLEACCCNACLVVVGTVPQLRDIWEETSFQMERLQAAAHTVEAEQSGLARRTAPQWRLPYTPEWTPNDKLQSTDKVLLQANTLHP